MEEFLEIRDFPDYEVSSHGRIINVKRGKEVTRSHNAVGELTVGLMFEGKQYRRSVKVLVARAFVPGETQVFNTPILLDGNRDNVRAENIQWRPFWFAHAYTRQFTNEQSWWFSGPVMDIYSQEIYDDIYDAGTRTGSLLKDVRESLLNHSKVFPGRQIFKFA